MKNMNRITAIFIIFLFSIFSLYSDNSNSVRGLGMGGDRNNILNDPNIGIKINPAEINRIVEPSLLLGYDFKEPESGLATILWKLSGWNIGFRGFINNDAMDANNLTQTKIKTSELDEIDWSLVWGVNDWGFSYRFLKQDEYATLNDNYDIVSESDWNDELNRNLLWLNGNSNINRQIHELSFGKALQGSELLEKRFMVKIGFGQIKKKYDFSRYDKKFYDYDGNGVGMENNNYYYSNQFSYSSEHHEIEEYDCPFFSAEVDYSLKKQYSNGIRLSLLSRVSWEKYGTDKLYFTRRDSSYTEYMDPESNKFNQDYFYERSYTSFTKSKGRFALSVNGCWESQNKLSLIWMGNYEASVNLEEQKLLSYSDDFVEPKSAQNYQIIDFSTGMEYGLFYCFTLRIGTQLIFEDFTERYYREYSYSSDNYMNNVFCGFSIQPWARMEIDFAVEINDFTEFEFAESKLALRYSY